MRNLIPETTGEMAPVKVPGAMHIKHKMLIINYLKYCFKKAAKWGWGRSLCVLYVLCG